MAAEVEKRYTSLEPLTRCGKQQNKHEPFYTSFVCCGGQSHSIYARMLLFHSKTFENSLNSALRALYPRNLQP